MPMKPVPILPPVSSTDLPEVPLRRLLVLRRDQVVQEGERVGGLVVVAEPAGGGDELAGEGALHLRRPRLHPRPHRIVADHGGGLRGQHAGDVEVDRRRAVVADVRLGLAVVADRLQPVAEAEAARAPVGRRAHDRAVADRPEEVDPAHHRRQRLLQHLAVAVVGPEHPGQDGDDVAPAGASRRSPPAGADAAGSDRARRAGSRRRGAGRPSPRAGTCGRRRGCRAGSRRSARTPGRRRSSPAARRAAGSRSAPR